VFLKEFKLTSLIGMGGEAKMSFCVCDFNIMFTYIGVGTEGSAHDMRVLKQRAVMDSKFPRPPKGLFAKLNPDACTIYGL